MVVYVCGGDLESVARTVWRLCSSVVSLVDAMLEADVGLGTVHVLVVPPRIELSSLFP